MTSADAHPTTWTAIVPRYLDTLAAAHRSPGTVRLHRHYLHHLAWYVRHPLTATERDLVRALAVPGWSAETRKSCRSVTVGFYRWAHRTGLIDTDPAAGLPSVSVPSGQPRPAPDEVLAAALGAADRRTRTMIRLAALDGLRCAEIARVHTADLVGVMLYVHGKGGKVRRLPVVDDELRAQIASAGGFLFPGQDGGHLAPATVSKLIGRTLPPGWTAHTLRHRFATRSYAGTRDLLAVGAALGHARPETTQRYVAMPHDALLDVVRAAAWVASDRPLPAEVPASEWAWDDDGVA